jgi:hypothetical protein
MKRVLLATVLALAFGAAPAHAAPFATPLYTINAPDGWQHLDVAYAMGVTGDTFLSPGATMVSPHHNIPAAGGIAIEISYRTIANLEKVIKPHKLPKGGAALLQYVAGIPAKAKGVKLKTRAHALTVAGTSGASGTITYTYGGAAQLQRDVAARRGNHVFLIELVCSPDLAAQGEVALRGILASLAWK